MSRTRSSSRGFTLIEVVLVIGAIGLVLGLCGGLLHVLLRLDRIGRAHLVETATVGRLARQFRQDVHAATRTKAVADGPAPKLELELALPEDRMVAYEARPDALVRTQHHGAAVERREAYTLASRQAPDFLIREAEGKVWVSLRLPRGAEPDTGPKGLRHDLRIDALAGRDHRRSQPRESTP